MLFQCFRLFRTRDDRGIQNDEAFKTKKADLQPTFDDPARRPGPTIQPNKPARRSSPANLRDDPLDDSARQPSSATLRFRSLDDAGWRPTAAHPRPRILAPATRSAHPRICEALADLRRVAPASVSPRNLTK
jgi:hypothetical protein